MNPYAIDAQRRDHERRNREGRRPASFAATVLNTYRALAINDLWNRDVRWHFEREGAQYEIRRNDEVIAAGSGDEVLLVLQERLRCAA